MNIAFCASDNDQAEPFSTLNRLNNLVIKRCTLRDAKILCICSTTLSSLTFRSEPYRLDKVVLSTQNLCSFAFSGIPCLNLCSVLDVLLLPSISSCIFSSQMTSLELSVNCERGTLFPKYLNLATLTNLHLRHFVFCASDKHQAEPFSACHRLDNLSIDYCSLRDAQILSISSTTLSSLTIRSRDPSCYKVVLSTPNLCSFAFAGVPCHDLYGSSLSSLEQVNIDADTWYCSVRSSKPPLILLNWLKELANVQSLTITANTLQVLFLIPDLLKIKLPSLGNLKSLKVKMKPLSFTFAMSRGGTAKTGEEKTKRYPPTIPDGIVDFLLQNSPSAEVSISNC